MNTTIKTPAQDRFNAERHALETHLNNYEAERLAHYQSFAKDALAKTYDERRALVPGALGPKPASASKASVAKALAAYDRSENTNQRAYDRLAEAASVERRIVSRATEAHTPERVLEDRKAYVLADLEALRSSDDVADTVYRFEAALQVANRWSHVRTAFELTDGPVEALEAVAQDVEQTLVQRARYGVLRSSSATSNLREEAITRGLANFLDDVQNLRSNA